MKPSVMKKSKGPSYNLLLIPEDHRTIKKVRVSGQQIQWLVGASIACLLFFVFNVVGFWHYRSLYASLEQDRQAVMAFQKEKKELVGKVVGLEKTLSETESLTGRLAAMVGTERVSLKKGIGPIAPEHFDILKKTEPVFFSELQPKVEDLQDRASTLRLKIQELSKLQEDKLIYMASTPSVWPTKGWVTSDFGVRRSPFTLARDFHDGIDIAAQWGTPVMASADGVVTFAGYRGGLGKAVIIDHGFGITSYYGHTSELLVHEGQKVMRGMQVARVGSTGHSTGPHLHYEIHVDGVPVDPMKYIVQ